MRFFKYKQKLTILLTTCILSALCLTGCGKDGKLNEGDCKCNIMFSDIPKEFQMLEESLLERFEIEVTLQNPITEKEYDITLNRDNDFFVQASLNPGTYQVKYVSNNMKHFNSISVTSDVTSVELRSDITSEVPITLENAAEFSENWMATQPSPEIRLADKFSRQIQVADKTGQNAYKLINIADIVPELNLSYDTQVKPYEKISVTDSDYGITVFLLNNSDQMADWQSCEVIGIEVSKNKVVFPEGVTLGMSADKVLHKTEGLYGAPDSFTGTALFGWGYDKVQAIYNDPTSGDKITVTLNPESTYCLKISYEFSCFE